MKLAVKLTMQGLIRALRAKAHDLAEDLEQGQADARPQRPARQRESRGDVNGIRRD
ncbi:MULTISPECIES: hypothetical protein [Mesorhizobium]|uniref:hypothetical protein n=1 Tax=Mesorhizobium TaxID=68287 RepID=UPI001314AFB0|nr:MULTISPECIES: hypothetical protein [Mesorhizobium]